MNIEHLYNGVYWGGGISFCDFDNDGLDDLSISSSAGEPIYLYKNQLTAFTDIAFQFPLLDTYESKSVTWADYDNDGDRDLFITSILGKNKLYRNDGSGRYSDVTESAGISTETLTSMGACWGDYDNDGWLDLYVVNYSRMSGFGAMRNYLYRNRGEGTFSDVTLEAGVGDEGKYPFIAVFFDYNNDGWQDIYIANDRDPKNTLFKNLGNGTFSDVSVESHADLDFEAMGIAVGDYNNDGWLDLYVSNNSFGNGLLRNNGDGTFTDVADSLGVKVGKACWGVNFIDYDNDSDLDLYVSASHGPTPGSSDRKNVLFENLGEGTFSEIAGIGLDGDNYHSYGNAIGDFDNNGYCDIAVLNSQENLSLWKNSGGSNHWIKIELQGTASNRDGIGSVIEIHREGRKFIRTTHCGISYNSQNSFVETIGVGTTEMIDSVVVKWPLGTIDVLRDVPVDQTLHIVEGRSITAIVDNIAPVDQFTLYQNYPNPFNPTTRIGYELKEAAKVTLKIYTLLGEEVKTLVDASHTTGYRSVVWDGRDSNGYPVSSGIYVYQLSLSSSLRGQNERTVFSQARKMILLK